jgi:hypothetical protein
MVPGSAHETSSLVLPVSLCAVSGFVLSLLGSFDENGKARPATGTGGDVDAMPQNSERLPHDEETDAEALALCGVKPSERFEDSRYLLVGDSNARIVHVDPNFRAGTPATEQHATSQFGVLDCIAHQIAQGGAEKQAITEYRGVVGNRVDAYSLAQRGMFVLAARLPQDLLDPHRRELQASASFSKAQRGQDLLKLLLEPVNRALTGTQTSQFGTRPDSMTKQFMSALDDLQWLAKIVASYGEQQRLELRNPARSGTAGHAP